MLFSAKIFFISYFSHLFYKEIIKIKTINQENTQFTKIIKFLIENSMQFLKFVS